MNSFKRWVQDRWQGPSLLWRGLVLSTLFVVLGWGALLVIVMFGLGSDNTELDPGGRRAAVVTIVRQLSHDPSGLHAVLSAFDTQQRHHDLLEEGDTGRLNMIVRDAGKVVFASPGQDTDLPVTPVDQIERVKHAGQTWQQLCSADGAVSVCLVSALVGLDQVLAAALTRKLLLPPLLLLPLTLPGFFLALWWSLSRVRASGLALKRSPQRAAEAIPMDQVPRELRPFVEGVEAWRQEMLAARQRERDFVGNAAHELRTPLTAIQVNVEAMQRHALPAPVVLHLQGLLSGCQRMTRVVEQLLALLRIESRPVGEGAVRSLNLSSLLQERLAVLNALADAKPVSLVLSAPDHVRLEGHQEPLESVVDNLVGNAIKYSPPGAEVNVVLRQSGDWVHLDVRDTGPGIADADKPMCFERFRRHDTSGQPGAGLGLSIVKSAVEAHGGRVLLENPPQGTGLWVQVVLPVSQGRTAR